jgi:hypothetical protein
MDHCLHLHSNSREYFRNHPLHLHLHSNPREYFRNHPVNIEVSISYFEIILFVIYLFLYTSLFNNISLSKLSIIITSKLNSSDDSTLLRHFFIWLVYEVLVVKVHWQKSHFQDILIDVVLIIIFEQLRYFTIFIYLYITKLRRVYQRFMHTFYD